MGNEKRLGIVANTFYFFIIMEPKFSRKEEQVVPISFKVSDKMYLYIT
jgi:hypothetical protein